MNGRAATSAERDSSFSEIIRYIFLQNLKLDNMLEISVAGETSLRSPARLPTLTPIKRISFQLPSSPRITAYRHLCIAY